jgi:transposase InsO family protein
MTRDRGSNYTATFAAVLADAGIRTVLRNIQTPRMNAIAERWIGGCRRKLLDRTLIWNLNHLRQILRQYQTHHNQHRPHRPLESAAPLRQPSRPGRVRDHRQPGSCGQGRELPAAYRPAAGSAFEHFPAEHLNGADVQAWGGDCGDLPYEPVVGELIQQHGR